MSQSPSDLCLLFLDRLGARDLDKASELVTPDFRMTFPGGQEFTRFEDLMDWAAPRYQSIAKKIDRVEETPLGDMAAVYISGSLYGERPDGTSFEGIRFIDRFQVQGNAIQSQEVWNDLAECGLVAQTA